MLDRRISRRVAAPVVAAFTGVLLTSSACIAAAVSTPPAPRVFSAKDIFGLKRVADAQISPDGRWIAFTEREGDINQDRDLTSVWLIPASGAAPPQLVKRGASHPRWSPDGGRIAYLDNGKQGGGEIGVVSVTSGAHADLSLGERSPADLAWSPDGRSIAFTAFVPEPPQLLSLPLEKPPGANWAPPLRFTTARHVVSDGSGYVQPGHTHLFVVATRGGAARQLTFGSTEDASPAWSPDGAALVYSSHDEAPGPVDFGLDRIRSVDVATGKVARLSPDPIDAGDPVVSPDGRYVAFVGWVSPHPGDFFPIELYVMDRDGSHVRAISPALDRIAQSPRWSADGRSLLFRYADRGVDKVARAGLDGRIQDLAEGVRGDYSVSRDGVVAFPLGGADHPADLGTAQNGRVRRLTHLNDPLLAGVRLATLRPLPVRSSHDGAEVGAWILLPPGYDPKRRYPTILEIHGGPYGQDGPYWRTDSEVFAGAGYAVIYANYRGSTSYGLKFSTAIDRDFPGAAPFDDLMSAVDAAVAAGVADPARLYVTGGSAGGELTAWIVGRTQRFQAAVAVKPVIDQISGALGNDQYLYDATSEFGATPWADPGLFWKHSPLSLVGAVSTPTLLMVGDADRRTPLAQSLAFYDALQIRGVPTGLVIVPGAGHESLESRLSQRIAEDLDILAWFSRYPGAETSEGRKNPRGGVPAR